MHFAVLSEPLSAGAHWMPIGDRLLPGTHSYLLTLFLVATAHHTNIMAPVSPLERWIRTHSCAWQRVPMLAPHPLMLTAVSPPLSKKVCAGGALPPATDAAYVRLGPEGCGGHGDQPSWCVGNATGHLFNTANSKRRLERARQGYHHVLHFSGCRLRLYGERRISRCLSGRSLLLMGSAYNVDLRKGFARINSSLAAWTRRPPGPLHPNVADFWRAFEKPSGQYCYRPGRKPPMCTVAFGRSAVTSSVFHFPSSTGLGNLREKDYKRMCDYDLVVLESGLEDLTLPASHVHPARGAWNSELMQANATATLVPGLP